MNIRKTVTASLFSAVLLGGALAAAPTAQAQTDGGTGALSCYGSAKSYSKPAGNRWYPQGGPYLTATTNCADINIKPNSTTSIAVCWLPSSGGSYCQSGFKTAPAGQWTVVATDVLAGTHFYFDFGSTAANSGVWAA
ncbi:hypothetical protein ACFQ9Z_06900 [Streptomyces sp. NPDC056580]|uniref:hypothetical protein n=1 Tax=Streptomyces sp. NPDC056580 TaxID=3345872 RepID=UPI0036B73AE5